MTEFSFDQIQQAFVDESITLEEFVQILIENIGAKETKKVLKKNIKKAEKIERIKKYKNSIV